MSAVVNVYSKLGPKISQDFLKSLESDRIIFNSKNIWLTFKANDLKGEGIYISSLKRLSKGRLISTGNRFIAVAGGHKIIDIPKEHKLFNNIVIDRSESKRFKIEIDLSIFQTGLTGYISLAYHISPELVIM